MRQLPEAFPIDRLVEVLETRWRFRVRQLDYLPVGFGGHHWRAVTSGAADLFLSVHELDRVGRFGGDRSANFDLLRHAFDTARWLEAVARLDFVLGPLPDSSGAVLRRLADKFAVHVYPWTDGETLEDPDGTLTAEMIARLHAVTERVPPDLTRVEDFQIPFRSWLEDALTRCAEPWTAGPYAEPARHRLQAHAERVRSLIAFYDGLAAETARSRSDWVITHGEPWGTNLIRTSDGRIRLVDWDTALIATRERDLWQLPGSGAAQRTYQAMLNAQIDSQRVRLYEVWFELAELAIFLSVFRAPHEDDLNLARSWQKYVTYLPAGNL